MSGPTSRDQRVDAVIPVRFADAKEFLVEYSSNISLGGVFVRTANPAAYGTVVRLSLELPGTGQSIPVTGQVAFVLDAQDAARQGKVPGMGVRFARLDPAVQQTLAAYVETQQRRSKGRVLLVDDDALTTQQLADMLRGYHLNVTTASNAIKALEILRFGGIDFVISDINMPRMDGFEFRDNLRNNPKTASLPFVFLTSSENPADVQLAAELGVHHFLRKPVDAGSLLALLRQVLGDAAFQPDAPGAAASQTEERIQRKKVQERRIVEIAFRKFVSLGLDTRFTADERGVYGQLTFRAVNVQDPATGARLERAGLYSVGHDKAKPFWPRALGALPVFNILDVPDAPSLERMLAGALNRRIDAMRGVKQFLDANRIPNRYDPATMRVLGLVTMDRDEIVFSVRDRRTLFLETLNGRSFGEVAAMRARLVDVSDAKSGVDMEIALETATNRLRQSMAEPALAAPPVTAIRADGTRSTDSMADLSAGAEPDSPAPAPSGPPSPPAVPVAPGGTWIGEPEEEEALAAAAIDLATKAAVAASIAAAAPPAEAAALSEADVVAEATAPDTMAEDDPGPAVEAVPEPAATPETADAPFAGEELDLAGGSGEGPALDLDAAAMPDGGAVWTARDVEAPPDEAPAPELESLPDQPPAALDPGTSSPAPSPFLDMGKPDDLDSTLVPRSEPADESLSPEEREARRWADEWTGDVSTAEPLWTIQPGEESIETPSAVTEALTSPPATARAAADPAWEAAAGGTAMVCTLCSATYHVGDELDDERLLLVCPSCIASSSG